jgi:predicted dehydrogenase/threonine dehydrogenase-like Zn-dependent dehydrogenase
LKQVLIKDGAAVVAEVPAPQVGPGNVLVRVANSCISAGTEMANVTLSALPLYRRAMRQPQHVRRVIQMIKDQGLNYTMNRVRGLLDAGSVTGYSAAGTIVAVGSEVSGFAVGDRVACAGAGIANHAEFIDVPVNLAVHVPDPVAFADASTVTLGAIALQGVRRTAPTLGETVVVVGLGFLGQLTAQFLRASGCRVIGVDPDAQRRAIAEAGGAMVLESEGGSHVERVIQLTDGAGADAVVITAASSSSEIVSQAFRACRRKGRVVLVGDVGLELKRADFYAKEIDFFISTSYGPGRYDPLYEEAGQDYPLGYVRWTENRNMQAYLEMLADGRVSLAPLKPRSFPVDQARAAYDSLKSASERSLISLLEYSPDADVGKKSVQLVRHGKAPPSDRIRVALVGAGGFAQGMHLPNLQKLRGDYTMRAIASRTGANASSVAQRYGAEYATTDFDQVLGDKDIDLVIIATRHHLHADMTLRALKAGKHVLVEKPLALTEEEVRSIQAFYAAAPAGAPVLMTGFNRRFSPAVQAARQIVKDRSGPLIVNYRMNAGHIPSDHWVHGPEGGGRNIGEGCHIYDVFHYLTGSLWKDVKVAAISTGSKHFRRDDNFIANVEFEDGSVCSLTYTALGSKTHPKEQMEVFSDGRVLVLDDYKKLTVSGGTGRGWSGTTIQKGQYEELEALAAALRGKQPWPISLEDQVATTLLSFAVQKQLMGSAS